MSDPESSTDRRVVAWLREYGLPPDDPRRTVLSRLSALEAEGAVDEVRTRVWGKSITMSEDGAALIRGDEDVRETYREIQSWAERTGHSLEPAFRRSSRSSLVTDREVTVVHLPLLCLTIYEEGRLVGVYPCTATEGTKRSRRVSTGSKEGTMTGNRTETVPPAIPRGSDDA